MLFFSRDLTRLSSEAVLSKGRPHALFLYVCGPLAEPSIPE